VTSSNEEPREGTARADPVHRLWERLALAAILGVGALVNLYRLDLAWFANDQVRDAQIVHALLAGRSFPLVGPLVGGTTSHLGPLYFYLIALPYLVTKDPLAGTVFVAFLKVGAILLLYRFARGFFGAHVALAASALFAVFPPAVLSARVQWNPGMLPFFTIAFIWMLCALGADGESSAVVGLLVVLAVLTQLHMTTVPLVLVAIAAVMTTRPRVRWIHVATGAGIALLLYLPLIVHEATHGFENARALVASVEVDQRHTAPRAWLLLSKNLPFLFRPVLSGFSLDQPWSPVFLTVFSALYALESALFILGACVCVWHIARRRRQTEVAAIRAVRLRLVLLLWLVVPLLALGFQRTIVWCYYLDVLYPSEFIFAGIGVSTIASWSALSPQARTWVRSGLTIVLAALVASQTAFQIGLAQRIAKTSKVVFDVRMFTIGPDTGRGWGSMVYLPVGPHARYAYLYGDGPPGAGRTMGEQRSPDRRR